MTNDSEFSTSAGHRLLKNQTNKRVSADAGDQLVEILQERGTEIAEQAKEYAEAAGRKTVRKEDIRRAVRALQ
jgi:histone H3/H4